MTGDLSSLKSVLALAEQIKAKTTVLDVLWKNASAMINERKLGADGIELQMAVSHLAWFANSDKKYRPFAVYYRTKLANVLFTQQLARRLASTKAIAHSFHPGWLRTSFGSSGQPQKFNAIAFFSYLALSPEKGADTGVFLATAAEPGTMSDLYCAKRKVRT